jgi:RimJ/RimL family protein N-acetyltransferase
LPYAIVSRIPTASMTRMNSCESRLLKSRSKIFVSRLIAQQEGGIGFRLGDDVHRHTAEVGYWIGESFWGRGIMSEAVAAFTDFCFNTFPLRRIYAEPFANNPASVRVLEKAGFVYEGRLKNNVIKNGQLLDSLLYAKTR